MQDRFSRKRSNGILRRCSASHIAFHGTSPLFVFLSTFFLVKLLVQVKKLINCDRNSTIYFRIHFRSRQSDLEPNQVDVPRKHLQNDDKNITTTPNTTEMDKLGRFVCLRFRAPQGFSTINFKRTCRGFQKKNGTHGTNVGMAQAWLEHNHG